jgi:hypothetical protein
MDVIWPGTGLATSNTLASAAEIRTVRLENNISSLPFIKRLIFL